MREYRVVVSKWGVRYFTRAHDFDDALRRVEDAYLAFEQAGEQRGMQPAAWVEARDVGEWRRT